MKTKTQDEKVYPGAAIDAADNGKVNDFLEKQATCELNNNPRNTDEKL